MRYLSIDPGNNTGWALFNEKGDPTESGEIKGHDKFMDWLEEVDPKPDIIIFEVYTIDNRQFNHQGSNVPTLQLIGMIKRYASKNKIKLVESRRVNLKIGLRFMGVKYPPGEHVPDQVSALAHGVFYLTKHNIRKSRLEKK